MKKILSIDGGGIRGIIPALILADFEKQTGKSIAELFDLIAGTSTGGLLALGLVKPDGHGKPQYSADALAKLYKNEKERIFSPLRLDRFDHTVSALLQERYGSKSYEDVLHNYFSDFRLSDALTEVIIMCYEIERRKPWVFRSCKAKDTSYRGINENARMKDIARATSAAPTYFEPKKIEMDENFFFVDGGMFANNPAMYAYAEAKTLFPDEKDFLLVSLGTGEYTRHIRYEKAKDWGLVEWAPSILDIVFDGVSKAVDYQLNQLLPFQDCDRRYYRFQSPLTFANDNLDDISDKNVSALCNMAEYMIDNNKQVLQELCSKLSV